MFTTNYYTLHIRHKLFIILINSIIIYRITTFYAVFFSTNFNFTHINIINNNKKLKYTLLLYISNGKKKKDNFIQNK